MSHVPPHILVLDSIDAARKQHPIDCRRLYTTNVSHSISNDTPSLPLQCARRVREGSSTDELTRRRPHRFEGALRPASAVSLSQPQFFQCRRLSFNTSGYYLLASSEGIQSGHAVYKVPRSQMADHQPTGPSYCASIPTTSSCAFLVLALIALDWRWRSQMSVLGPIPCHQTAARRSFCWLLFINRTSSLASVVSVLGYPNTASKRAHGPERKV